MTKPFSLYLDVVRFLAALAVFVAHVSSHPFTEHVVWWRLATYGDVAVTLFFVLSGYVISYVTATREQNLSTYFSARVARLYSVVAIGLILTITLDLAGMQINPDFYTIKKVLWKPESWTGYLSSAVFVNEFQIFRFNGIAPGTNGPYWSLSFEATYYVVAALILFCRRQIWIPVTFILLFLAGRTITALLPIWGLGFFLHRSTTLQVRRLPLCILLATVSAAAVIATPIITRHLPTDNFGIRFPWGRAPFNRNLVGDYFVVIGFSVHLISMRQLLSQPINIRPQLDAAIRWLGSLTFPLYCFHYPAICFFAAISPWSNTSWANLVLITTSTIGLVIVMTPMCERLKISIRRGLAYAAAGDQPMTPNHGLRGTDPADRSGLG